MSIDWMSYCPSGLHDELIGPGGGARTAGRALIRHLSELGCAEIGVRQQAAELAIKVMGVTFTVYHEQDGSIDRAWPLEIIASSRNFRPNCVGISPPRGVWAHICGTDLVRDKDGTVYVLEDNLRVPSGVSYMIENRQVVKRVLPELFENTTILPVDDYPAQLHEMLVALSPRRERLPEVVVLTPGIYNSAY